MSKIKKYMPKVLSGVLSLTILCFTIGVASYSAGAKSTDTETTNTMLHKIFRTILQPQKTLRRTKPKSFQRMKRFT